MWSTDCRRAAKHHALGAALGTSFVRRSSLPLCSETSRTWSCARRELRAPSSLLLITRHSAVAPSPACIKLQRSGSGAANNTCGR